MAVFRRRIRPKTWQILREQAKYKWQVPLYAVEWTFLWLAYWLSGWAFLEVLEYMGTLSLLLAVISYFCEGGNRIKQRHYQAWQVINSAQGKGGNGGRIDALEELHADHVPLVGVDVSNAFLQGIDLSKASLLRANFRDADVRKGQFEEAILENADLTSGNFRGANFEKADFAEADLQDADLSDADLSSADLRGANLSRADLRGAQFREAKWQNIATVKLANLFGIKNAPREFLEWAEKNGAVSLESDSDWQKLLDQESEHDSSR